jgi:hypothetical protein
MLPGRNVVTQQGENAAQTDVRRSIGWIELDRRAEMVDSGDLIALEIRERTEREVSAGVPRVLLQNRLLLGDGFLDVLIEGRLDDFLAPE